MLTFKFEFLKIMSNLLPMGLASLIRTDDKRNIRIAGRNIVTVENLAQAYTAMIIV